MDDYITRVGSESSRGRRPRLDDDFVRNVDRCIVDRIYNERRG